MRTLFTLSLLFLLNLKSQSQISSGSVWTWMAGDSVTNQYGEYGTKDQGSSANTPGARTGSANWLGSDGNLYLFGGGGYAKSGIKDDLGDFWQYNVTSKQWIWIAGDSTTNTPANYGQKGIFSSTNYPGARQGSASWVDENGNFWLYGGIKDGAYFNDLWEYDFSLKQWAWISGDNTAGVEGVYGIKGQSSKSNKPGGRSSLAHWQDSDGNFWIFGGNGLASDFFAGFLNDVWMFNTSSLEWTWISGDNVSNPTAVYGNENEESPENAPAGISYSAFWKDYEGNFWTFGGASSSVFIFNGIWKYNVSTNMWSWHNGQIIGSSIPKYGLQNVGSPDNNPGKRNAILAWINSSKDKLYLFGGNGLYNYSGNYASDLWYYDIKNSFWVWVKGDTATENYGHYGTLGVPGTENKPGGRYLSTSWTDQNENIWLFGGVGFAAADESGFLNDLWNLGNNVLPLTLISFDAGLISSGVSIKWQTQNETNISTFEIEKSTDGRNFISINNLYPHGHAASINNYAFIDSFPFLGRSYYRLKIIDLDGKYKFSAVRQIVYNSVSFIKLYPNPANDILTIYAESHNDNEVSVVVSDIKGASVLIKNIRLNKGQNTYKLQVSGLSKGLYILNVIGSDVSAKLSFLKQ